MENPEIEDAVLAACLKFNSEAYFEISDLITDVEYFSDFKKQIVWDVIKNIFDESPDAKLDATTLHSKARSMGCEDIIERERPYIREIYKKKLELTNVRRFAKELVKCRIIRDAKLRAAQIVAGLDGLNGTESIDEITSTIETPVYDFINSLVEKDDNPLSLRDGTREYIQHLLSAPPGPCGLSTGYACLDQIISWLRRKSVTVISSRFGTGKTTITSNIAMHVAGNLNEPVLITDTEMSEDGLRPRLIANLSEVTINDIEQGHAGSNIVKIAKINEALDKFEKFNLYYHSVAGDKFDNIISYIRRWVNRYVGIDPETGKRRSCLVVLDYLKIMEVSDVKSMKEHEKLGHLTQALHDLTDELDIPMVVLVQENKENWVAGSDRILWFATSVISLLEKSTDEINSDGPELGNRKAIIRKARFGQKLADNDYICFNLDGKINRLTEIGIRSQITTATPAKPDSDDANDQDAF